MLIGTFCGAVALAIDLLQGKERTEASWEYQRRAPFAEEMRDLYRRCGQPWLDYPEIVAILHEIGIGGINPLLSEDENLELFHTRDTSRMGEVKMLDWNLVVTSHEHRYNDAKELLAPMGELHHTDYYNVLVMRVEAPETFLATLDGLLMENPRLATS